jgi:hypothetical protein
MAIPGDARGEDQSREGMGEGYEERLSVILNSHARIDVTTCVEQAESIAWSRDTPVVHAP